MRLLWTLILGYVAALAGSALREEAHVYVNNTVTLYASGTHPTNVPVFDFRCAEANVLKNKTPCLVQCNMETLCQNAVKLCQKYRNVGCAYVLLRNGNKFAALKRSATVAELKRLDLSVYPSNSVAYSNWKQKHALPSRSSLQSAMRISFDSYIQYQNRSLRGVASTVLEALAIGGSNRDPAQYAVKAKKAKSRPLKKRRYFPQQTDTIVLPKTPPDYCGFNLKSQGVGDESGFKIKNNDIKYMNVNNMNKNITLPIAAWRDQLLSSKISLVLVNMHSPFSLLNSLQSWNHSGLLAMLDEKIAILSQASATEIAICESFGIQVVQPKHMSIPKAHKRKTDVLTIASAFYYGLHLARNEHVLFLESDFSIDLSVTLERVYAELLGAVGLLARGIALVRLSSRKSMGTYSFQDCAEQDFLISNDPNDVLHRKRNWYRFYCPTKGKMSQGTSTSSSKKKRFHPLPLDHFVTDCLDVPALTYYKCFTSRDSGWSLNACLVKKNSFLNTSYSFRLPVSDEDRSRRQFKRASDRNLAYPVHTMSIPEIGVNFCSHKQDAFEDLLLYGLKWGRWEVPLCLAVDGLFLHTRIDAR